LRLRPAKPALGNGRLQRQAKLAFWGCGSPLSTSEILEWAYPPKVLGERIGDGHRWSCRRALESIGAVKVGRGGTIGRPDGYILAYLHAAANTGPASKFDAKTCPRSQVL